MNIAYFLADPGIGVFGTKGASVHVQEVVRALRTLGHRVSVFAVRRDAEVPADLRDLDVVTVPARAGEPEAREAAVAAAAQKLSEEAARQDFDLVYERFSLFSTAGARLARRLGVPFVLEVNAPLIEEQRSHRVLHDEAGARAAAREQCAAASLVTCVSAPVAAWVRGLAPGARVVVVPNGVNTARIAPRTGEREGPLAIGFVGTLKPWHGTDVLLRAFAGARPEPGAWRLDIVGTGPQREALEQEAQRLGITADVTFHGALAPEQVPAVLAGFDIATAPYPAGDHYFSPLKVYEYLAAGVPTVASAIGELPALVEGRGLLVEPGNDEALGLALLRLAGDPALRERQGRAARAAALAEHSWVGRCQGWLGLLAPALAGEARRA